MDETINDKIDDDELDALLEHFAEMTGDLKGTMERIYKELMFMGTAINKFDILEKDALNLNLRMCIRYNQIHENYLRLKELIRLSSQLNDTCSNVEIDQEIIRKIIININ